jgi:hypothetical protein
MSELQPWVALTPANVKSGMTSRELNDFSKAATDGEPDSRIEPILVDLVDEIRGFIVTWSQNTLSSDVSLIPPSFKARAVSLARWRVLATIPGYQPGKARELEYEKAEAFFNKVAEGKIRPQPAPDAVVNPVPQERPQTMPRINARRRRFSRDQQDGI